MSAPYWVYGWWCDTWPEAIAKAEAIGKPVKGSTDGPTPTDDILYIPESDQGGTYA